MKKQEQTKSIVLTAEQLKKQGLRTTSVMTGLEMMQGYTNTLMLAMHSESDKAILLSCINTYLHQVFGQIDCLYKELDGVAYHLLECDNEEELRAYRVSKGE